MKNIIPLLFISSQLFSQTVTPLASSVIDDALLTANFASTNNTIEISNVNIEANDFTIGVFQGFANHPVSQGIILSTGGAEWGVTGAGQTGGAVSPSISTDPYLQSLVGAISPAGGVANFHNIVSIEFDFIPHFDVIDFEYTFASTEYANYTCSSFNDVFGFFLTGPGISGTYHNSSENLARVPGTANIPVCINSINSGTPSNSYPDSGCTYVDPNYQNNSYLFNENIQGQSGYIPFPFNGYTETLSISDSLIPDSTYHLKIVISDVNDGAYNSAVFLAANSFSSYPIDSTLWGCTDSNALNYNANATFDDGSCVYQNVSVEETEKIEGILSHIPNPIKGNSIEVFEYENGMQVSIYDYMGNKIKSAQTSHLDVSDLESGIYIIELSNGKFRSSAKFIKL